MNKLILSTLSLLCASTIHAAFLPMSSRIDLPVTGDGVLHAKDGIVTVPLDSLKKGVTYSMVCTLSNNNDNTVDIQPNSDKVFPQFLLENRSFHQTDLKKGDSHFEARSFIVNYPGSTISFRNLDDEYSASVSHCSATPDHF